MQEKKVSDIDIRYVKGVGPKNAGILNKLRIRTVEDLLYYLPRRYEDRRTFVLIRDVTIGEFQTIRGQVLTFGIHVTKRGMHVFQLALGDTTGVIYCVWFNQPFLKKNFKVGQEIIVYGKVEKYDKLQIHHPEYEIVSDEKDTSNAGTIVPVYPLTQDVTQRYIRHLVHEAMNRFLHALKDSLPTYVRARRRLVDLPFAIRNIHFPGSFEHLEKAYKRLVFGEFFVLQLALALRKKDVKIGAPGVRHERNASLLDSFRKLFDFDLTSSQERAIGEIEKDMTSARPMNRLLEGDVGSGKTVVALYALLLSAENGYQAALMAPTEILANQHFITISELLMPFGISVRLLVNGIPPDKKAEIKREIENGEADIVIGTHALIWEGIAFKKLGLVIVDEQHKFGVTQRHLLRQKGTNPDVLVMTATPIPRTLAMTVYGDLDISVIKELPKGRHPITTYWAEEEHREKVYAFIREEVKNGRQAYIVYPRVWSTGNMRKAASSLKAATQMYHRLQAEVFPEFAVSLIHGRMAAKEKDAVMARFKKGKIDVLVSTTVIEVGIDVANASVMVIENAERFGLSQLHQLRGRIGRGEYSSYCILIGDPRTEAAKRRFLTMTETQDGFKVAEEDLRLRGPGEFFGTKQHGLPEIRFGNILRDFEIMEEARQEAFALVSADPHLTDERNRHVKAILESRFADKLNVKDAVS
jgi:ATP-dependent DNA helicase RecG